MYRNLHPPPGTSYPECASKRFISPMMPSTLSELPMQHGTTAQRRQERDRLRLLAEVSESIASHRDLNELFRDLAQRLPRIVPFDYINLVLHDASRNAMRLHLLAVPQETQ